MAVVIALIVAWNVFVARNSDGLVVGRVVDELGAPVEGASVVMYEAGLLISSPRQRTETNVAGEFRFAAHGLHHFRLEALRPGFGRSKIMNVRLYFRNQNTVLVEPLRIVRRSAPLTAPVAPADVN